MSSTSSRGFHPLPVTGSVKPVTAEDMLRTEFFASARLQAEFGRDGVEDYVSYRRAERRGLVKLYRGGTGR